MILLIKCISLLVMCESCKIKMYNKITYISSCEGKDETFQQVQTVIDARTPSFFHQWFHCLERTQII